MNGAFFLFTRFYLILWIFLMGESIVFGNEISSSEQSSQSVSRILGGSSLGYARAIGPYSFHFPEDHSPHPDFRNEWWYFTGNLQTEEGRHFGYQFTLFRNSLSPKAILSVSNWATNQVFMGHFAITDVQTGKFHHFERFSRAALGLAGSQSNPFRIWLENWSMESAGEALFPLKIKAVEEAVSLELNLTPQKKLTLQGEQGLSQKGHTPGNASYYYSFTRLKTEGKLRIGKQNYALQGLSWMDREWSTSALEAQQSGWDWFSLQLTNGWDLMFYQLRLKNGQPDTTSSGVLVSPQGATFPLNYRQLILRVLNTWKSPATGIRYPAQWELKIPQQKIVLTLTPHLDQQEFRASFTYWEGAVQISGQFQENSIEGHGYVELTGYEKSP